MKRPQASRPIVVSMATDARRGPRGYVEKREATASEIFQSRMSQRGRNLFECSFHQS